jgi:hypothetical protein
MEVANNLPALYKALAAFQSELPVIEKTATVDAGKYKFTYAPLDQIMKTVYPLLSKNGLAIRHELNEGGVEAILSHEEGAELRSGAIQVNRTGEMKSIGGSLTYARRYSVTMLLGIASEEDTDAGDLVVKGKEMTAKDAVQNMDITKERAALAKCKTMEELKRTWTGFTPAQRENVELMNTKNEMKESIEEDIPVIEDTATPPDDEFADVPMTEEEDPNPKKK